VTRQDIYKKVVYTNFSAPIARENIRDKPAGHFTKAIKNITVILKMETTDQISQSPHWAVITP
jgi:hypothetical protein